MGLSFHWICDCCQHVNFTPLEESCEKCGCYGGMLIDAVHPINPPLSGLTDTSNVQTEETAIKRMIEEKLRERVQFLRWQRGNDPIYNQGSAVSWKAVLDGRIEELQRVLTEVLGVSGL